MKPMTRRQALKLAGGATAIVPLAMVSGRQAFAADMVQVDPEDANAKALEFVHARSNPEQQCKNFQLDSGEDGADWGPCNIFPGKVVNEEGWCKSWVKKTG